MIAFFILADNLISMKQLLICALSVLIFQLNYAQKTAKGYYISYGGDTVFTTFKLPKKMPTSIVGAFGSHLALEKFKDHAEVIDENGSTKTLAPDEAIEISFTINSDRYRLVSKPSFEARDAFLIPEIEGQKVNLYQYSIDGRNLANSRLTYKRYFFTIEKKYHGNLFIDSDISQRKLQELLKEFFNDSPETIKKIDEIFSENKVSLKELRAIIDKYNSI